jgi:hypothetical protein
MREDPMIEKSPPWRPIQLSILFFIPFYSGVKPQAPLDRAVAHSVSFTLPLRQDNAPFDMHPGVAHPGEKQQGSARAWKLCCAVPAKYV